MQGNIWFRIIKAVLAKHLLALYSPLNMQLNILMKMSLSADLCPQANVSEMLLGGNGNGEKNLQKYYENQRTIALYIKASNLNPTQFMVKERWLINHKLIPC
jgi:hypothetical protein